MNLNINNANGRVSFGEFIGELPDLSRSMFQVFLCMDKALQKYDVTGDHVEWFRRAVHDYMEEPASYEVYQEVTEDEIV